MSHGYSHEVIDESVRNTVRDLEKTKNPPQFLVVLETLLFARLSQYGLTLQDIQAALKRTGIEAEYREAEQHTDETFAQRLALVRIHKHHKVEQPFAEFRATCYRAMLDPALFVNVAGMMIGIEKDGYAHT